MGLKVVQPVEMNQVDGNPFDNSKYFTYGDYKLHYRIDEPKTKKVKGKMFMIREDTKLVNFPGYCKKCKTESVYAYVKRFGYNKSAN